jgi:hypothetical protein
LQSRSGVLLPTYTARVAGGFQRSLRRVSDRSLAGGDVETPCPCTTPRRLSSNQHPVLVPLGMLKKHLGRSRRHIQYTRWESSVESTGFCEQFDQRRHLQSVLDCRSERQITMREREHQIMNKAIFSSSCASSSSSQKKKSGVLSSRVLIDVTYRLRSLRTDCKGA